jgi:hypothetical protein
MDTSRRFTSRQITVMVVAVSTAVFVAAPVAALAAAGSFTSSSAGTPAVSAKNTSSGSGAKAVFGNASASRGTTYGVYGRASSSGGFGVYSAGRLGSSGKLVCTHCVTGGDVDTETLPSVPSANDANALAGHAPAYYARIVPLSELLPADSDYHTLATVDGLSVLGKCTTFPQATIAVEADSSAAAKAEVNYFYVDSSAHAQAGGAPLAQSVEARIAVSTGPTQTEGSAIYRNNATGREITINYHLYAAAECEVFGDVLTAG